jgi:probable phosphoglycerate mutase
MPGISLGSLGRNQAKRLGRRFKSEDIASVQTSPLERARETAQPIAAAIGREPELCEAIAEIDFGEWTGRPFEDLAADPRWRDWNSARPVHRPPEGESMLEAQSRIVGTMEELRRAYHDRTVVLVSHGDVIKAALLYHLGLPIGAHDRIEIEPASISTLLVGDWGSKLIRLNEVIAA